MTTRTVGRFLGASSRLESSWATEERSRYAPARHREPSPA